MDDYISLLIFIFLLIMAFTIIQLKENKLRRLQAEHRHLQSKYNDIEDCLKRLEVDYERLTEKHLSALRRKDTTSDLEKGLKEVKRSKEYFSAKRLEQLGRYVASPKKPEMLFLQTFEPLMSHTIEQCLEDMIIGAKFEIVIMSPWIKRPALDKIKVPLECFIRRGGMLKVFMRGDEHDFACGFGDDIRPEIEKLGGEVVLIEQLHAILYMTDRKEAIVTSANLSIADFQSSFESGVWLSDPVAIKDICGFIDNLYSIKNNIKRRYIRRSSIPRSDIESFTS